MLPWKHHTHQITINLISLSIIAIFLKAVLNITGTLFIMVQYNAKKSVVSEFAWKLGFSQTHGLIKLINYLYTSKTVPQSDFSGPFSRRQSWKSKFPSKFIFNSISTDLLHQKLEQRIPI